MVGAFSREIDVPFLDLLPVLRREPHETLWVSPVDMHPNERAQALVAPSLAAFVAEGLALQ
jgi:hypothetical protein